MYLLLFSLLLMGLFKILVIIIAVYLVFRIIARLLLPYLIKRFIEKQKEFFYQHNPHVRRPSNKKEGEMSIHINTAKRKKENTDNLGEYVDFEDINS
mgnify:CR=1 FL=1